MTKVEKETVVSLLVLVTGLFCILLLYQVFAGGFPKQLDDTNHNRAIIYSDNKSRVDRGNDPQFLKWATSDKPILVEYPCSWSIESDTQDVYLYVYDEHSHLKARLVNPSKVEVVRGK